MNPGEWSGLAMVTLSPLALAVSLRRRRTARRLRRLRLGEPGAPRAGAGRSLADEPAMTGEPALIDEPAMTGERDEPQGHHRWRPDRIRLVSVLAGMAVALTVGGWGGLATAILTSAGLDRGLWRLEPAAMRRRRWLEVADLPLAADLMAAVLRAGAPTDQAVGAVADTLGGPLGERLHRVARTLRLGGTAEEAWSHLGSMDGATRMARAAIRSAGSGASLSGTLARLAEDLRLDRATDAETSARRAGVLVVLPLGLCFLPAFILAGLVPVIIAVLGGVL